MENSIFNYQKVRSQLCNMNHIWDDILDEYAKLHEFSEFKVTYITGLYCNKENPIVTFYHISGRCIVEWNYCFENNKIVSEVHRISDLTNIALEIKRYNETELKFNIKGKDVSLNNIDTNSGISLKLREIIIEFYKELLNQL